MSPASLGPFRFVLRSLGYHWRIHLGSALGAAVACAVLAGALIVGDSMRGTLRSIALERLGRVDLAVFSGRPFPLRLVEALRKSPDVAAAFEPPVAALILKGAASAPGPQGIGPRLGGVRVIGLGAGDMAMAGGSREGPSLEPRGRGVLVNRRLADELGLRPGDPLVLWLAAASGIPREFLAGRRDDPSRAVRCEVLQILPEGSPGSFSLDPDQRTARNVFVDRVEIARALLLAGKANAILLKTLEGGSGSGGPRASQLLQEALRREAAAEDLGLRILKRRAEGWIQVESEAFQIEPAVETAAREAAEAIGAPVVSISAYLATSITLARPGGQPREIPYSMLCALDPAAPPPLGPLPLRSGAGAAPLLDPGEILLGEWAAGDLEAREGDPLELRLLKVGDGGALVEEAATFRLKAVTALAGIAADPGLVPELPGLTNASRMDAWDPPFPIDLKRIRPADEDYWKAHRTTPKAFLGLEEGRRLWGTRFGSATAVRLAPAKGLDLERTEDLFRRELRRRLDPAILGVAVREVRAEALTLSEGTTDFGMLFTAFGFFVIAAALLLVVLFWALGLERRARQWGILRACGFSGPAVRRIALAEGAVVCGVGALAGLLAAPLVSVVFLEGLRWRLALAMRPPRLELHIEPSSLALGLAATLVAVFASTMAATRRISRATAMDLLGGRVRKDRRPAGGARRRLLGLAGLILLGIAAGLIAAAETSPALASRSGPALFFGAGASILTGGILLLAAFLLPAGMGSPAARTPRAPGAWMSLLWLGLRNLKRHPGRSFLTVALMAFASFVIAAAGILGGGGGPETGRDSGTGGFAFAAATDIPLVRSLSDPAVRDDLGIPGSVDGRPVSWDGVEIAALRREDGADASCLNLYRSARPPILGAPPEFIRRGGFRFKASLARTAAEKDNPWLLLRRGSPEAAGGGPIPAVADGATALWSLHLGLGGDLEVPDGRGGKARLRLVGLLGGSILQGSLVISEESLLALYPRSAGRRLFLVGAPPGEAERIVRALSEGLAPFGFDPVTTERLLEGYRSVERAYLDTFLALGGLGLILGAAGLGAVLLRGILERRGELALLRALGWSRGMLSALVLAENSILVAAGLGLGTLAALASALPHLASDTAPLLPLALTLAGVAAVGLGSGLFAVRTAVRAGIVEALRGE